MSESSRSGSRLGKLLLRYDLPCRDSLSVAAEWHEYRDPEQLDTMKKLGASQEWLETHVLDRLEDGDVWFATDGSTALPPSEVMQIRAQLRFGQDLVLEAFLIVVQGDVASATVFDEDAVLSQSDVLDDENLDALRKISRRYGCSLMELLPIRYTLADGSRYVPRASMLKIPLPASS